MRITFFDIQGWEAPYLKKRFKGHELKLVRDSLSGENVKNYRDSEAASVFIYSKMQKAILEQMPKLKVIATRSTGFDHIDVKECKKRNIPVFNVPFYGENTVAEHTFALILSLSRKIYKAYVKTLRNDFSLDGLEGFDLKGKTLGVVGGGHIGLHVVRIAKGFGMNVIVYDVNRDRFLAEVLGFEYAPTLEHLLKHSDILTLHVPYNEHTHHLINRKNIQLIKRGALLINTARGGVVETEALLEALDKKIFSGIGLDVLEGEDLIKEEKQLLYDHAKTEALGDLVRDHILLSKDNVVFTPHIAFYSKEALERILETTADNVSAYLAGDVRRAIH